MPGTTDSKPTAPSWLMPLLGMVLTVVINLVLFSNFMGKMESRIVMLEQEKQRREARELERLYEYEKAKAAKYQEMEDQINRLKNTN